MEETNRPITQPEIPAPLANQRQETWQHQQSRRFAIFGLAGAALLIASFFIFRALYFKPAPEIIDHNPLRGTAEETDKAKPLYTLDRDPETGAYPVFGTDESKTNSGEAFIDFQDAIIANLGSSEAEVFQAVIDKANFYTALGLFDYAEETLNMLDSATLSDSEQTLLARAIEKLSTARNAQTE